MKELFVKSLLTSLCLPARQGKHAKGRNYPSLAKRGEGRFCEEYVFSLLMTQ